jgi:hypothetical protein
VSVCVCSDSSSDISDDDAKQRQQLTQQKINNVLKEHIFRSTFYFILFIQHSLFVGFGFLNKYKNIYIFFIYNL